MRRRKVPALSPAVSEYFAELARRRHAQATPEERIEAARIAGLAGWDEFDNAEARKAEMKRRQRLGRRRKGTLLKNFVIMRAKR